MRHPAYGACFKLIFIFGVLIPYFFFNRTQPAGGTDSPQSPPRIERACDPIGNATSSHEHIGNSAAPLRRAKAIVTAYSASVEETDETPCLGAAGFDICWLQRNGHQVCASNDYPFGTKLLIDGLGECEVWDRMNKRFTGKRKVDWFMGNRSFEAREFGVQTLQIAIY